MNDGAMINETVEPSERFEVAASALEQVELLDDGLRVEVIAVVLFKAVEALEVGAADGATEKEEAGTGPQDFPPELNIAKKLRLLLIP